MEGKEIVGRKVVEVEGINVGKENENDEEILKKIIANHPLFEVMIESHINCLKVGSEDGGIDIISDAWKKLVNTKSKAAISPNTSELDHFMEAYCMALSNLKEVMEEPTKEAKAFINATYIQLQELNEANNEPAT
ncbi:homeobox protein knotted-1-like 1 [Trifolium pratense]|uniref:Uncharacterized protein n=1 Tax=Trifolium pratense TaxID=57577 RepID=A0ACB0M188_TRIPR|nr:homeobox protein knotted-1-like 1 [Trifolium pratense]CAJ2674319.1 unnamed protein product [Trifolium pratense]